MISTFLNLRYIVQNRRRSDVHSNYDHIRCMIRRLTRNDQGWSISLFSFLSFSFFHINSVIKKQGQEIHWNLEKAQSMCEWLELLLIMASPRLSPCGDEMKMSIDESFLKTNLILKFLNTQDWYTGDQILNNGSTYK